MTSSDKTRAPTGHATRAAPPAPPVPPRTIASVAPGPRRTIASYVYYADAERAADWLADRGFPVERGAIVGTGLRSVERLAGRMTAGRAAFVGAVAGIIMGALLALLVGIWPWASGSAESLTSVVVLGVLFGAVSGALLHEARSGGRRDFVSATRIEADRYDLQFDEGAADDAERLLAAMPARQ